MALTRLSVEADDGDGDSGELEPETLASLLGRRADDDAAGAQALATWLGQSASTNPAAGAAIATIATHERDRRVALEQKIAEAGHSLASGRRSVAELSIPPERFAAALRRRYPDEAQLSVTRVVPVPGGRSKGTILLDFTTSTGPRQIVVRRDFEISVAGTSVSYEYPVVRAAYDAGLQVPEPLWLEDDPEIIGGRFIAFERVAGKAMGTLFQSEAPAAFVLSFAAALARLHAVDLTHDGLGDHLHWGRDDHPVAAMIEEFYARYRRELRPYPLMDAAFAWLRSQIGAIGSERALVHGDAGLHNTLGDGDRLTALLDWEFSHAGDPAEDLTYCKYLVERIVPWTEFMAAYQAAGGKPVSSARMRFFTVWRTLHLAILTGNAREMFESGRDRDLRMVTIGYNTFPKQLRDLAVDLVASLTG